MIKRDGWGLAEQHLLPDAVVAFVDGELSAAANMRVRAHLAHCPFCAAEAATQQQARGLMRSALPPAIPGGLLASLRTIPQKAELPSGPDQLAMTEDGQIVAVLRSSADETMPLGTSQPVVSRRVRQSTGVVVSGLVFGVLALVAMHGDVAPVEQVQPAPQAQRPITATPTLNSPQNSAVMLFPGRLSRCTTRVVSNQS